MCGIVGHLASDSGGIDRVFVNRALTMLAHRGPDGQRSWSDRKARVCLGHARLAIIDLSDGGAQPMVEDESQIALVFNGEIYNYLELREVLRTQGHRFRTTSDSEVLLRAYLEWGTACLGRLNGMFAFAIWDGRAQRLFAARDRFGEKPFYYRSSEDGFRFASEIKALLKEPKQGDQADERAIVRYLALTHVDGEPTTFFRDVRQLPPAHWLAVTEGRIEIGRYWDLAPGQSVGPSDDDNILRFRELFFDAVRLRLRSDVAVGTGLSGGLDSSSVVGAVRALRSTDSPLQATFSARFREGETDEGRFIEEVVRRGGVRDYHVFLRPEEVPEEIERLVWHQDEPFVSLSIYAQFKVMQLAHTAGVTVLLDGQGADEFLAGYHTPAFGFRMASLVRDGSWRGLVAELLAYRRRHGPITRAIRYFATGLLPDELWSRMKARAEGMQELLRPGLLDRHIDTLTPRHAARFASPLKESLYRQLTLTSLPSLLRFGDRNSMAFSRESRLPFLDHRLVEFVMALPEHLLVADGTTKVILRRALAPDLPPVVAARMDKVGFAPPQDVWLRGPLRSWFESVLDAAGRSEFVVAGAVKARWQRFLAGRASLAPLWRIANLHLWRQRFGV